MTSGLKTRRSTCGLNAVDRRPRDPRATQPDQKVREFDQ
jgi:hypothetical protein